jgi:hypothetical protein
MSRSLLIIIVGLAAAVSAHVIWFNLHAPCTGDELECQLAWMRSELKLTNEQYARIKAIHENSSPRLLALAGEVARMREEYAAFERARVTEGKVDFVEFALFVEQRRMIDRECLASTRRLLAATADVMNPNQRERYLGIVGPAGKFDAPATN